MKYLIYLRVSKKDQDERTQLDHALTFIKQRDKTDFQYEVFKERITSKKPVFLRPEGKLMLETARRGDIIIGMRVDRLCRKLYEATQLIDLLEKKDIEILLVDQPGIKNKIMLGLYAGMAEEEVKLLRKRVSETLKSKKNRGERYSRFLPYGYAMHETKLVPIKKDNEIIMKRGILVPLYEEQLNISMMQKLQSEGMGYQAIAKTLTNAGLTNREGKPFQKMTVYRILKRLESSMPDNQFLEEREAVAILG